MVPLEKRKEARRVSDCGRQTRDEDVVQIENYDAGSEQRARGFRLKNEIEGNRHNHCVPNNLEETQEDLRHRSHFRVGVIDNVDDVNEINGRNHDNVDDHQHGDEQEPLGPQDQALSTQAPFLRVHSEDLAGDIRYKHIINLQFALYDHTIEQEANEYIDKAQYEYGGRFSL